MEGIGRGEGERAFLALAAEFDMNKTSINSVVNRLGMSNGSEAEGSNNGEPHLGIRNLGGVDWEVKSMS